MVINDVPLAVNALVGERVAGLDLDRAAILDKIKGVDSRVDGKIIRQEANIGLIDLSVGLQGQEVGEVLLNLIRAGADLVADSGKEDSILGIAAERSESG